ELGDLAVLLHARMSPVRALWFNAASSLTSIIGGLAGFLALRRTLDVLPYAISVAAASLVYVAVADLIPGLHRRVELSAGAAQVGVSGCGVAGIACGARWLAVAGQPWEAARWAVRGPILRWGGNTSRRLI